MNNFIFYDTETSGVKELDFIQVIQFAAIQTNDNFIKKAPEEVVAHEKQKLDDMIVEYNLVEQNLDFLT